MNETEQLVLDSIDADGMLNYLCEIISIPSYGGKEEVAQKSVSAKLKSIGLDVDVWDIDFDEIGKHPAFSTSFERDEGIGVVASMGEKNGGRDLILNGHIDVVSHGEEANWNYPPWEGTIANGRVYGRGSCDMKGGLCSAIYAAKAIQDAGVRLKGKLMIHSVIGEEDGGCGTLATLLKGYKADGAVVMEPTELKIAPAHAGALSFRINVNGKSAHACVREEGVSSIEKFIIIHDALKVLEIERNSKISDPLYSRYKLPFALNIGKVQGGNWPGTVPEKLFFEGRIGVSIGESIEEARKSLENSVAKAASLDPWLKKNPPKIEWRGYQFDSAKISIEHPLVKTVKDSFSDIMKIKAKMEGMTYASDMRHFVNTGKIPALLFGPGDVRNAHSPNEYVTIKELIAAARTLAMTALRFCGYNKKLV